MTPQVLIGLGASSIGRMPQGFVQNASDVADYTRRINGNQLATVRGIALTDGRPHARRHHRRPDVLLARQIAAGERLLDSPAQETLAALRREGLVHQDGGLIIVPESGASVRSLGGCRV